MANKSLAFIGLIDDDLSETRGVFHSHAYQTFNLRQLSLETLLFQSSKSTGHSCLAEGFRKGKDQISSVLLLILQHILHLQIPFG